MLVWFSKETWAPISLGSLDQPPPLLLSRLRGAYAPLTTTGVAVALQSGQLRTFEATAVGGRSNAPVLGVLTGAGEWFGGGQKGAPVKLGKRPCLLFCSLDASVGRHAMGLQLLRCDVLDVPCRPHALQGSFSSNQEGPWENEWFPKKATTTLPVSAPDASVSPESFGAAARTAEMAGGCYQILQVLQVHCVSRGGALNLRPR